MTYFHETPFEATLGRVPDPLSASRPRWRQMGADICFILIKAGAFLGSIYLGVLALPLVFFLLLTGGDLTLLFTQLGNLSAHYLAADHARRLLFEEELKLGLFAIATVIAVLRLPAFLEDVAETLARDENAK